jgi:AAHS family 4-hydroxybenzoate transporter-like MFS transporter
MIGRRERLSMPMTFSAAIARAPLRPFQILVALVGLLLLVVDGIDLQSLPLVTPPILKEWGIDRAEFGPALAASLFGMGFGSILGGMLGDRIGRLRTLFLACLIFGLATISAAFTHDVWEMSAVRALGGLGFGAAYPNALALVSDWVPERWRGHVISLVSIGIPVGISVSAAVMPFLLPTYGWRGAFIAFGGVSILLGALAFTLLREPPPFLLARGKVEAARKSAAKVIDPTIELLPESSAPDQPAAGEAIGIFHPGNRLLNIGMVISFSATTTLVYGLLNWTTVLLTSAGFTLAQAQQAGVWQGILSIVGGLSAGLTTRTFGSRTVIVVGAALIFVNIVALGSIVDGIAAAPSPAERSLVILLESLAVGLVSMMITVFYVVMAHGYPTSCRSGGIGFVITSGRLFSIAMVYYGGTLLNLGGDSFVWYFAVLAAISLLVFAAAFIIDRQVGPARKLARAA